MHLLITRLQALWSEAFAIWAAGGWAMAGIAAIALVLFALGVHVWYTLRAKGFTSVPEPTWRGWLDRPEQRQGPLGELLDRVADAPSLNRSLERFRQLRAAELSPLARDLKVMRICVSAAPLVGLLGTVMGMLDTFGALAVGTGGDKTMGLVAAGISEALITTETGLVIALPGLFFQYQLQRGHDRYKAFLAHLETVCNQALNRRLHPRAAA